MRILVPLVQVLHVDAHTREGSAKLKSEQRLNDSGSPGEHLTFNPNISPFNPKSV